MGSERRLTARATIYTSYLLIFPPRGRILYPMERKTRPQRTHIRLLVALLALALALVGCGGGDNPNGGGDNTDTLAPVETITLERQPCFGFCPVYTVTLHADGRVEYDGTQNVEATGAQTANVDPATVQALADQMTAAGYFDWEDEYAEMDVTDMATVITSITLSDGTTKRIRHYYGDDNAPAALTELEGQIDLAAGVAQWVGDQRQ